jgi:hypothetical protein
MRVPRFANPRVSQPRATGTWSARKGDLPFIRDGGHGGAPVFAPPAAGARQRLGPEALTSGFQRALIAGSLFLLAAAAIAARATNTRGESAPGTTPKPVPMAVTDAA